MNKDMTFAQAMERYTGGFVVTGIRFRGGRFKPMKFTMIGMAMAINLWNGSVWGVLPSGKRERLKRVIN